jgi:hypothetical protein
MYSCRKCALRRTGIYMIRQREGCRSTVGPRSLHESVTAIKRDRTECARPLPRSVELGRTGPRQAVTTAAAVRRTNHVKNRDRTEVRSDHVLVRFSEIK